ncbi:unnamed protein product [Vicia faba]|uniref:Gag-pol polyprotein n=1 Tax=Vicia faba TaxID=3906 RepID=A0AAV0YWD6_VICFA|nr:unnamed protein product [Vicia faba]
MNEDESVQDFHMTVLDIANDPEYLGEKISEDKLIRKMLRSLPRKFDMKVIAIEESHDISTMIVDELVGSLKTFKFSINERYEKKEKKSITFTSSTKDSKDCDELNL